MRRCAGIVERYEALELSGLENGKQKVATESDMAITEFQLSTGASQGAFNTPTHRSRISATNGVAINITTKRTLRPC